MELLTAPDRHLHGRVDKSPAMLEPMSIEPARRSTAHRGYVWGAELRAAAKGFIATEILVDCPQCTSRAVADFTSPAGGGTATPRLTCNTCGYSRLGPGPDPQPRGYKLDEWWPVATTDPVTDRCFGLPLWLQSPCKGHVLWAVNMRHLDYIEEFVGSGLRDRSNLSQFGSAIGEQLPHWMASRNHRASVLRAIGALRQKA